MDALQKNVAVARGEAMAAQLLAMSALQTALMIVPGTHREALLEQMNRFVDETLNMGKPAKGDPHDELNTLMREVARNTATNALDHITRLVKSVPKE